MKEEDINKAGDNEQLELTNEISLTEEIPPTDDNSQEKDSSEEHNPSLTEVLKERATEDEAPLSRTFSLKKILGGDILYTSFIRRQVWLFLLIAMFMVVYIANRYSCQQDIIEIDKLQDELLDAKYKALSSNSQLTEKSRQSNILDMLKNNKDSTLKLPTQPPYIITVPE
jgi:cell division protein FtsL